MLSLSQCCLHASLFLSAASLVLQLPLSLSFIVHARVCVLVSRWVLLHANLSTPFSTGRGVVSNQVGCHCACACFYVYVCACMHSFSMLSVCLELCHYHRVVTAFVALCIVPLCGRAFVCLRMCSWSRTDTSTPFTTGLGAGKH